MDKSWIDLPNRTSKEYVEGIKQFITFTNGFDSEFISCPCRKCANRYYYTRDIVREHLILNGFLKNYKNWIRHGEEYVTCRQEERVEMEVDVTVVDPMIAMLNDIACGLAPEDTTHETDGVGGSNPRSGADEEALRYFEILDDAQTELYPGCKDFSKLSFIVELLHLKALNQWTDKSFDMLLQLLHRVLPFGAKLAESYYHARKLTENLGFTYETLDACPNNCMLFRNENADLDACIVCKTSRWKNDRVDQNRQSTSRRVLNRGKLVATKQMRYFPLKPRLKRLFMSSKISKLMRWHVENSREDEKLTHPADSLAWKDFDKRHPDFALDSRSVRLGLAADGFNPFRSMVGANHSTWPVVLVPYNLPPWLCMKQPFLILSTLIDGPRGPGDKIDVYMQPLIDELNELWVEGVMTFDAEANEMFKLRAALLWTINDFPAYANLSGWSTKGEFACPCCNQSKKSTWLKHSKKWSYTGHRRFLPPLHRFRRDKVSFDGTREYGPAPQILTGVDLLSQLEQEQIHTVYDFQDLLALPLPSTSARNRKRSHNWKKKSIFYKLPYWKDNILRHNLDVMHIEKNVCDNILWTILGVKGKSKDSANARRDLQEMGLRKPLHIQMRESNKAYIPPAQFTMSKDEKEAFLSVLKGVKVPDGYCSNISKRVNMKEMTLQGLKSHDNHILIQQLIPISIRNSLPNNVVEPLIEVSNFFRQLCSRVQHTDELKSLQDRIALTLCHLEKLFPPSFFDVMVHLTIHLTGEALLGGPVQFRWMYPIERYMNTLKRYVRNKARPEASIAKGYLMDECTNFCAAYLNDVETKLNRPLRINDGPIGEGTPFDLDNIEWIQAHRYVLFNTPSVVALIQTHIDELKRDMPRATDNQIQQSHFQSFHNWFKHYVYTLRRTNDGSLIDEMNQLADGPFITARRYTTCDVNGFRFRIKEVDEKRATQNSGISCFSVDAGYYFGELKDIVEVIYNHGLKFLLFKSDWVDPTRGTKVDKYQFTLVNFNNLLYPAERISNEPYIFASQAEQVYYVKDPMDHNWHVVVKMSRRGVYQIECDEPDIDAFAQQVLDENVVIQREEDVNWVRETVEGDTFYLHDQ